MRRTLKNLAATAVLSLLLAAPATHAQIVTLATSGTIGIGEDPNGIFGSGPLLDGLPFSMSVSVDTALLYDRQSGTYYSHWTNYGRTAILTGALTIGGHTYSWNADSATARVSLVNAHSGTVPENDSVNILGNGTNSHDKYTVTASGSVYSTGGVSFLLDADPLQPRDLTHALRMAEVEGFSHFATVAPNGTRTYFSSRPELTRAVWAVSPVPEPSRLGMLLAGLAGFGYAARRRHRPQGRGQSSA